MDIDILANEVLNLSRDELMLNINNMDLALSCFDREKYEGTMATDGNKLQYHPEYVLKTYRLSPKVLLHTYLHMLLHCLFQHPLTEKTIKRPLWGLACDIAVENVIMELDLRDVFYDDRGIYYKQRDVIDDLSPAVEELTAENIYEYLSGISRYRRSKIRKCQEYFRFDDHSLWYKKYKEVDPETKFWKRVSKIKINRKYQIDKILLGKATDKDKECAGKANINERLSLVRMMVDHIVAEIRKVTEEVDHIQICMSYVKSLLNISGDKEEYEYKRLKKLIAKELQSGIADVKDAEKCLGIIKEEYNLKVRSLLVRVEEVRKRLSNVFVFCEEVFGEGQEMTMLVTALTANADSARFISEFGCDEYFRHNKGLLFYERERKIMNKMKKLGASFA